MSTGEIATQQVIHITGFCRTAANRGLGASSAEHAILNGEWTVMQVSAEREAPPVSHPVDDVEDMLAGFDARLAERVVVPTAREFELADLDSEELLAQSESIRCLLERLASVVAAAYADAGVARGFLQRLDLKLITRDHDWRSVFRALADSPAGTEQYQLVALARYRQYLETRASLIERLLAKRGNLSETAELERVVLDEPKLVRLPSRRPVLVPLEYRGELALWLGGHRFVIRDGFPPELIDPPSETSWPLQREGMMIGRHPENDIVVDARFDQVSRAHAILEWPGYTRVIVVDLSTGGTFLERRVRH